MQEANIFQAVNEKYDIVEVARDLGIRIKKVASGYRANSIANNGEGENAFAIYPNSNSWYDFMLEIGGDVTDLVAYVKYNGDKGAALRYLMPEWTSEKVRVQISAQQKFNENIERWNSELFNSKNQISVNALKYLHSRGLTDETIKALKIGLHWGQFMQILFPYWDESKKNVLYYMTRRFDTLGKGENMKEPKYVKASLEANPFLKNTAWGLHTLNRNNDEIWITEGMFDALHLDQIGASVLAPNGGDFGKMWPMVIEKIIKFKKVILAFDNDKAGQEFTYKAAKELVRNRVPFKVAVFLGKDIAEYFENGGNEEFYCSSADWMPRNLERRVEIMFPVQKKELQKKLWHILDTQLKDTEKAHVLNSKDIYVKQKKKTESERVNSQRQFSIEAGIAIRESALENTRVFIPEMKGPQD